MKTARWQFRMTTNYLAHTCTHLTAAGREWNFENKNFIEAGIKAEKYKKRGISLHSISIIKERLKWFLYCAKIQEIRSEKTGKKYKYKLGFITLTLPSHQQHTSNDIKAKCLNTFLTVLRKYDNLERYLWRAELQKNGNIHFHIVTDQYIDYKRIQSVWNKTLIDLGYIKRFKEKHGHEDPPSTRVEPIYNAKKLQYYISKYMSKIEDKDYIEGRHWACSRQIGNLKDGSIFLTDAQLLLLESLCVIGKIDKYQGEWAEYYMINIDQIAPTIDKSLSLQVQELIKKNTALLYEQ